MELMNDSMAQPRQALVPLELPGWKVAVSWAAAGLLAVLFLASGLWKITDAQGWAQRVAQLRVPESLSLPAALAFGIAETVGAVLVFVPRFRRWGAILIGLLLLAFMGYFAVNYSALRGAECSCFPWVKRMVGPEFFIGDALMLGLAVCAGAWSKPRGGLRSALVIAGAVTVFALVSYGVAAVRQTGTKAPETVTVAGKPYNIQHGKVFLFFFDPMCMHCFEVSKRMSAYQWGSTRVVGVPVEMPQFGDHFMDQTGLHGVITTDFSGLKQTFGYTSYPFGVALDNGHEKQALTQWDDPEPAATLRKLGLIQ